MGSVTERQIRSQVERALGRQLPDSLWRRVAVDDRWLGDIQRGDDTVEELIAQFRAWLPLVSIEQPAPPAPAAGGVRRHRRTKTQDARLAALSDLAAAMAAQRSDVVSFRAEILQGRLLSPQGIDAWIKRRAAPARLAAVRLPPGTVVDPPGLLGLDLIGGGAETTAYRVSPAFRVSEAERLLPPDMIAFAVPGDSWVRRAPVPFDGPLRTLYQLVESLTRDFPWQAAQATVFVLTGLTPMIASILFEPHVRPDAGAFSRLTITLDMSMTPREVASAYGRYRAAALGKTKVRSLSQRSMALAVFAASRPGIDRSALLAAWNLAYPRWKFRPGKGRQSALFRFNRDLGRAEALLTQPAILSPAFWVL